jgi:hypothetical protein
LETGDQMTKTRAGKTERNQEECASTNERHKNKKQKDTRLATAQQTRKTYRSRQHVRLDALHAIVARVLVAHVALPPHQLVRVAAVHEVVCRVVCLCVCVCVCVCVCEWRSCKRRRKGLKRATRKRRGNDEGESEQRRSPVCPVRVAVFITKGMYAASTMVARMAKSASATAGVHRRGIGAVVAFVVVGGC